MAQPGRVHDRLVLVGIHRADGVDDLASGLDALRGCAEQRELELGQRLGSPAQVRTLIQHAEPGAGRVHERAVEAGQIGRQIQRVCHYDADIRGAQSRDVLLELTGAPWMLLDRHDLAGQLCRLAAGRGTEIEDPLPVAGAHGVTGQHRSSALRPDAPLGQSSLIDTRDPKHARNVGLFTFDLAADDPDSRLG